MGYDLNTELIFYILQIFNHLSRTFGNTLPNNFSKVAQFCASITRLEKVFQTEEMEKFTSQYEKLPSVVLKNVSFGIENTHILKNVSFTIRKPGLIVVTGPVGSGKTSLLKVILRDYQPVTEGESRILVKCLFFPYKYCRCEKVIIPMYKPESPLCSFLGVTNFYI